VFGKIIKSSTSFMEEVRGFNPNYRVKSELELKEFSAEESMRLFYVAITRAKKKLYITAPLKVKSFGKEIDQAPSIVFEELLKIL
jgi:superfamily I DNA/RNA helicase